jgi:hypothetical protein
VVGDDRQRRLLGLDGVAALEARHQLGDLFAGGDGL